MRPRGGSIAAAVLCLSALTVAAYLSGAPDAFESPYRLKVSEPLEGATVTGSSVRVTATLENRVQTEPAKDATPAPRPRVEILLDDVSKGTLKDGQTTIVLDNVPAGTHTLRVLASDRGTNSVGERKEIHFSVVAPENESLTPR